MKCSECSRRNHDDNQFCIYCGTALEPPPHQVAFRSGKRQKVLLPPQDIAALIADRNLAARRGHTSPYPVVVIGLAVLIGLAGVYYWFWYRDVFQIIAIDYQSTELMNE